MVSGQADDVQLVDFDHSPDATTGESSSHTTRNPTL
ncbi:MAG: hypothetical protein ACODAD_07165 [Planctomycetota bacterium]